MYGRIFMFSFSCKYLRNKLLNNGFGFFVGTFVQYMYLISEYVYLKGVHVLFCLPVYKGLGPNCTIGL